MKKLVKLVILILIPGLSFFINIHSISALPSENNAGHADISDLSNDIKKQAHVNDKNFLNKVVPFKDTIRNADMNEDRPQVNGALHFYDPTTGEGYLGIFPNARDRANDFFNSGIDAYCNSNNRTVAWDKLGHALHLLQDMTTPAHTNDISHIEGDSFEDYVYRNWNHWDTEPVILRYEYDIMGNKIPIYSPLPDDAKIIKNFDSNGPVYYSGLKDYLDSYRINHPYDPA